MASTYIIVRDSIPIRYNVDSGLVWDPTGPYIYVASWANTVNYGNGLTYIYRYDRGLKRLDYSLQKMNRNATFGSLTIDRKNRLYYMSPGGTTYVVQYPTAFQKDTLDLIARAEQKISPTVCQQVSLVTGDFFTDQYNESPYWWHVVKTDIQTGSFTCFYKDKFCDVDNPDSLSPLMLYRIDQTAFLSPGWIYKTGFNVQAWTADSGGTLWVYAAGPDDTGRNRYGIWKVGTDGIAHFDGEITSAIERYDSLAQGVARGSMRFFGQDGTLIITNGSVYIKYAPGGTVLKSLYAYDFTLPSASRPTIPTASGGSHKGAFRHPDKRVTSLWIGDFVLNASISVPTGGLSYFPRFTEISMVDLSVKQKLICTEIGVDYPFVVSPRTPDGYEGRIASFFDPYDAIHDPDTGELWAYTAGWRFLVAFRFSEVPIIPPPGSVNPIPQAPYCVPKNGNFSPFTGG